MMSQIQFESDVLIKTVLTLISASLASVEEQNLEDWDADEELLLIEAAEKMGIGNWQAIADYVGTKNKADCEQHYLEVIQ
ncbi:hypothetical protein G6F68_019815 [Rhizopus microsporus]|nr:hypothetical protein G6F68_019815 [Rhizopus microsporus]